MALLGDDVVLIFVNLSGLMRSRPRNIIFPQDAIQIKTDITEI